MPEDTPARGPRKALKFIGDVAAGKYLPGYIAEDFTQEQAEVWLGDAAYAEMIASPYYVEATKAEAKQIEAAAQPDAAEDGADNGG